MIRSQRLRRKAAARAIAVPLAAVFLIGIHVHPAHAYLDPGTGSILLQSTLALIAGTVVTLKLYWTKLKGMIWRRRPEQVRRATRDE